MTVTTNSVKKIAGQSWKTTTDEYTLPLPDEIIDAYLAGKKAMLSEIHKFAANQFLDLLGKAMKSAVDFKHELNENAVEVSDMYIKISSLENFEAALVIPDEVYLSEKQLEILNRASELEDSLVASKIVNIEFRFLPNRETLNRQKLFSNGFTFQYDPEGT